jgi:hypothetical protein
MILMTCYALLVSSHALPQGPEARARRWSARRRNFRNGAPVTLAYVTAIIVVEPFNGGAASQAVRTVLAGAIGGIVFAAIALLSAYAERLSSRLARARPRWQYLLFTLSYGSLAVMGVAAILNYRQGWLANVAAAVIMWSSAAALAMAGRAASWGRVRRAFWWHRPKWVNDGPAERDPCR